MYILNTAIFDIETNGFLEDVTEIFCISIKDLNTGSNILYRPDEIKDAITALSNYDVLIGHNILGYDLPVLEKLTGFKHKGRQIDTLILSKLRYPFFQYHSLEAWGEKLGYPKIDYKNFEYYEEQMGIYCMNDVEVNHEILKHLQDNMNIDAEYVKLEHEMKKLQQDIEKNGFYFDMELAMRTQMQINNDMETISSFVNELLGYHYEEVEHLLKKDGSLSHHANKLIASIIRDTGIEPTVRVDETKSYITVPEKITLDTKKLLIDKLLSMGWKPTWFTEKGSPKITQEGEVCPDLLKLGSFKSVGDYFVLKHRKGLVDGFFRHVRKDGRIPSEADTLGAVTGRYTHRKIANLPKVLTDKEGDYLVGLAGGFGKEIRSFFGVEPGRLQVGVDLSGIEARMLAHYMNDPEYTETILHGDIHEKNRVAAGLPDRKSSKSFFYGFLYGAGDEKVGSLIGKGREAGKAIKEEFLNNLPSLAELIKNKQKEASKGYIISLDKRPIRITRSPDRSGEMKYDVRKALNSLLQSSATIYFKKWATLAYAKVQRESLDAKPITAYHDELQWDCHQDAVPRLKEILVEAIKEADNYFVLNCENACEIKEGRNWADCH